MIGVNYQEGKGFSPPPDGMPILAIVPDWETTLSSFAGLNVQLWRFMGGVNQAINLAPHGAQVIWFNEND